MGHEEGIQPHHRPHHAHRHYDRIRVGKVRTGKITLRHEGQLRRLYIGRRYDNHPVLAVRLGPDVTVVDTTSGVILAEFHINLAKTYQR